jgi:hypothetical protein
MPAPGWSLGTPPDVAGEVGSCCAQLLRTVVAKARPAQRNSLFMRLCFVSKESFQVSCQIKLIVTKNIFVEHPVSASFFPSTTKTPTHLNKGGKFHFMRFFPQFVKLLIDPCR